MTDPRTFSYQKQLKSLPVPTLIETALKYLKSVRPLLTDEEYSKTQELVADFIKPGGVGENLHKRLLQHAMEQEHKGKSWLEDWWLEYGYVRGRYPLPINLSCHLIPMDKYTEPHSFTQTQQAARFIEGLLEWKDLLYQEKIPPEMQRKKPLCMNQFRTLFTTERQPRDQMDILVTGPPSDKVVVLVKNQFYVINIMHEGRRLSLSELELQLFRIKEDSLSHPSPPFGVGEFTTLSRDKWATIRKELEQDPTNQKIFKTIEQCVLLLSLDSHSPTDPNEVCFHTAAGVLDRWYDKIVDFIFFENGKVSLLLEHTPCDAPIIGRWWDDVTQNVYKNKRTVPLLRSKEVNFPPPQSLTWNLSPNHMTLLREAREAHLSVASTKSYRMVNFLDFGISEIKKFGCSPDSFMQLALQLAYYRIHKRLPPTYESDILAHTRLFLHGRTETVRTQSMEVLQFCKAMEKNNIPVATKYLHFKMAEAYHLSYMSDAVLGKGCDRHLFGLRIIHQTQLGGDLHPIYSDKAFTESTHHRMSTSSVPGTTFFGGFGNSVHDGYGCCYINKNDRLDVSVVTDRTCPTIDGKKFHEELVKSFWDIRNLFEEVCVAKL